MLTQVFILTLALISFSFIVGSQTVSAESSSLRIIPGGSSHDSFTKQKIQMSAEDII